MGRADQTIIRGGFKVQPDTVRNALERHPAVRAASVVGVDDERLGQVPVAVVELLRSLERMEADLAEMRSEVERMRRHLISAPALPAQPRPPR